MHDVRRFNRCTFVSWKVSPTYQVYTFPAVLFIVYHMLRKHKSYNKCDIIKYVPTGSG